MSQEVLTEKVIGLPKPLADIVPPERMRQNEERLLASTPEVDESLLTKAREHLRRLYLIHATNEAGNFKNGIVPFSQHTFPEGYIGNTLDFDTSLGLDGCTFFSWPQQPDNYETHGEYRLLISPAVLESEKCFVTPLDIFESAPIDMDEQGNHLPPAEMTSDALEAREEIHERIFSSTYQQLTKGTSSLLDIYSNMDMTDEDVAVIKQRTIEQLDNLYFNKLVSGRVWLEYVARMLAAHGPDELSVAEVKFNGAVSRSMIEARVSSAEYEGEYLPYVKRILRGGIE